MDTNKKIDYKKIFKNSFLITVYIMLFILLYAEIWSIRKLDNQDMYTASLEHVEETYFDKLYDRYSIKALADIQKDNFNIKEFEKTNLHIGIVECLEAHLSKEDLKDKSIYKYNNFDENFNIYNANVFYSSLDNYTTINYNLNNIWGYAYVSYDPYDDSGNYIDDPTKKHYYIVTYANDPLIRSYKDKNGYIREIDDLFIEADDFVHFAYSFKYPLLVITLATILVLIAFSIVIGVKFFKIFIKVASIVLNKITIMWKVTFVLAFFFITSTYFLRDYLDANSSLVWLFLNAVLWAVTLYFAWQFRCLYIGCEQLAQGNLENTIDTKYMILDIKKQAENINSIQKSISIAVDKEMKSEKLKTELITNVSHDIKTPLTSIINYTDLLSKEEIDNENVKEYIDVLKRQSEKLKTLIINLIDASKASTGNIELNMEPCNAAMILTQIAGEYEETLKSKNIELKINVPENTDNLNILADGKYLFRIFDNLMSNIQKYSLENTRAYVDLTTSLDKVIFSFKNVSKDALPNDETLLTERFYRGDDSRTTEGNGLGLAIALSLTQLMKGTMKLSVDGDLFKTTLTFDKYLDNLVDLYKENME